MNDNNFWDPFENITQSQVTDYTACIGSLIEKNALKFPDKAVFVSENGSLTFKELNDKANLIANYLLNILGEGPHQVCLWHEDSLTQFYAVAGIWKARKTLVVNDPSAPIQDNIKILEIANASFILTSKRYCKSIQNIITKDCKQVVVEDVLNHQNSTNPSFSSNKDWVSYLIFTSGSTGQPKAVEKGKNGLIYSATTYFNSNGFTPNDNTLFIVPLGHAYGPMIMAMAMICGSKLSAYPLKKWGVAKMETWIKQKEVSHYLSVPTIFRFFLKTVTDKKNLASIRLISLGGETIQHLDVEAYKNFFSDRCILMTTLGAAEVGYVTRHYFNKNSTLDSEGVPLGRSYPGIMVSIKDENDLAVPAGVIGELVVESEYIAKGYKGDSESTNKVFKSEKNEGSFNIYKTGDYGHINNEGVLFFAGRKDDQVKINGTRIELGEIESILSNIPNVKACAVKAWPDIKQGNFLVAYIEQDDELLIESEIREALKLRLSSVKIPSIFMLNMKIPLLSSGKLNRNILPKPESIIGDKNQNLPQTQAEKMVHSIWAGLFDLDEIGVNISFFALEGNSLIITELGLQVVEKFDKKIPLNFIFQHPTIKEFAEHLEQHNSHVVSNIFPISKFGNQAPLFVIHGIQGAILQWFNLLQEIDLNRPIFGVQGNEHTDRENKFQSVGQLAQDYADQIIELYPEGPYLLAGYSLGGVLAHAIAHELEKKNKKVEKLFIVDTKPRNLPLWVKIKMFSSLQKKELVFRTFVYLIKIPLRFWWKVTKSPNLIEAKRPKIKEDIYLKISMNHVLSPIQGKIELFVTENTPIKLLTAWQYLTNDQAKAHIIKGNHLQVFDEEFHSGLLEVFQNAAK